MRWGLARVTVRFGGRAARREVPVPVEPSDVTVVVGGDGAGKSTCLKSLVGLVQPDEGHGSRPPKSKIGYVSASGGLYTDLTVDENMAFAASAYGVRDADYDEMLDRLPPTAAGRPRPPPPPRRR